MFAGDKFQFETFDVEGINFHDTHATGHFVWVEDCLQWCIDIGDDTVNYNGCIEDIHITLIEDKP